jgi:glycosyltransferase involved in cell wall biosynthesis
MGSGAVEETYRALGWLPEGVPVRVIPYGVEVPAAPGREARAGREPAAPLRFGYIGSLLPHKGVHLAVAAFAGIDPARALLRVWGDPAADPGYAAELRRLAGEADVRFEGCFPEGAKDEVFAGIDLLLVPSLGLESFGLVAREAFAHGVPVVASRRGALAELSAGQSESAGELFDPDDPSALAGWVARLAAEPGIVAAWQRAVPPVKGMDEHAREIEAVYEAVLSARRRRR